MGLLDYRQECGVDEGYEKTCSSAVLRTVSVSTLRQVLEYGLTGGIGSGKSTVSSALARRGATVLDADAMVREMQAPGKQMFDMMVERWGDRIVTADGVLDRAQVAEIVFGDQAELDALNAMVHPAVAAETDRRLVELRGTDAIVVHDIPLLVLPGGDLLASRDLHSWSGIVVIDTAPETAVRRVVASRGLDEDEVRARQAKQATRDERLNAADFVIDNNGDLDSLDVEVDRCWAWMLAGGTVVDDPGSADQETTS